MSIASELLKNIGLLFKVTKSATPPETPKPMSIPNPQPPGKDWSELDEKIQSYVPTILARYASTEPADREEVNDAIRALYSLATWREPEIKWFDSPIVMKSVGYGLLSESNQLFNDPQSLIMDAVIGSFGRDAVIHADEMLGVAIRRSELGRLLDFVEPIRGNYFQVDTACYYSCFGNVWKAELFKMESGAAMPFLQVLDRSGVTLMPYGSLCMVADRPCELHFTTAPNGTKRFHKDGGMAIRYRDGAGGYFLNGVRMRPDYVVRDAEQITPLEVMHEGNVDCRRELMLKVGIGRMLSQMKHRIIDRRDSYELLSVQLDQSVPDARYLKMVNPSIGAFHIEGVPPDCDTVQKALNFRAGSILKQGENWEPSKLT